MKTKVKTIILIMLTIMTISYTVLASSAPVLNIVNESIATKYLEEDQGYINNKIISSNKENGEISMQLTLNNKSSKVLNKKENTEIFIIIPENIVNKSAEFTQYQTYIDELAEKIFAKNSKTKIGIIGIQGTIDDTTTDNNGKQTTGPNDEGNVLGTEANAEIVSTMTSEKTVLINNLENMNSTKKKYHLNLQAAIRVARKSFSNNVNKIVISLFDDVPNIAIDVKSQVTYGGIFAKYSTLEEAAIAHNNEVVNYTKSEILSLKNNNIDFILLRPDNTSFDQKWYSVSTGELELDYDGSTDVENLYGTLSNPTYGKMYSLDKNNLEAIVTEYIYNDVIETAGTTIEDAIIKIYFSNDILNNFTINFEDATIDITKLEEENYILWNIGNVPIEELVILNYSLKIKTLQNEELIDKIIAVNDKVEMSYTDKFENESTLTITDSPTIKLSIEEELINQDQSQNQAQNQNQDQSKIIDNTTATGNIPYTGVAEITFEVICLVGIGIFAYKKYSDLKGI